MKNSLLFVISIFVSIIFAELLTRVFYDPALGTYAGLSGSYEKHGELGWLPKKKFQGRHDRPGSFESSFSTNSLGLRDREHGIPRKRNIARIVALGDSFTWGFAVNDGENFTDILETKLDNTEVINLGVSAYDLRQQVDYFNKLGILFDPDILLLAFVMNDIYPAKLDAAEESQKVGATQDAFQNSFRDAKRILAENSALYSLLRDFVNHNSLLFNVFAKFGLKEAKGGFGDLHDNLRPALRQYPPELGRRWEITKKRLLDLKRTCDRNGIRLIIAIVPLEAWLDEKLLRKILIYTIYKIEDFDLQKPYRLMQEFADRNDIEIVDPLSAFKEAVALGATLYLKKDIHFSKDGHRLFADQIVKYLK